MLENLELKLTFKQMDHKIRDIFLKVRDINIRIKAQENHVISFMDSDLILYKGKDEDSLLFAVKRALFLLEEEQYKFMINEYYKKDYFWWMSYYSRSTYYRKKKEVMTMFLRHYSVE